MISLTHNIHINIHIYIYKNNNIIYQPSTNLSASAFTFTIHLPSGFARWPDGTKLGLEPEEEDSASETPALPKKCPRGQKKPKAKAKSEPGSKSAKKTLASDGGRTIETEYYNHPTLSDMPVARFGLRNHGLFSLQTPLHLQATFKSFWDSITIYVKTTHQS